MNVKVPKRIATTLMNALKGGVVPRNGLGYIAVGRKDEITALLSDIDVIADGGASFRFLVGKYGSGKSFLLQTIRNYAMERDYVVVDADLSPERRLVGSKGQGLSTYKELMQHLSTKAKPEGGGLPLILQKWISGIQSSIMKEEKLSADDPQLAKLVEIKIFDIVNQLEGMVHGFDFSRVIIAYWRGYRNGDEEQKGNALKWLRGEYSTKSEAKRDLNVSVIITDDDWYRCLSRWLSYKNFH